MGSSAKRTLAALLFLLYLLLLLRITVFRPSALLPQGVDSVINLRPGSAYLLWARRGLWRLFFFDLIGNIVCFLPFGTYLAWRNPKWPLWDIALSGLGLSLFIEVSQYALGTGIADVDDLILNTIGVVLGAIPLYLRRSKCKNHGTPA